MNLPKAIDFFGNFSCRSSKAVAGNLSRATREIVESCRLFRIKQFRVKFPVLILFGSGAAMIRAIDMKPIMMVYPGFQTLPKGLKQLLVESESFFFEEETTFFRRDRKPATSLIGNNDRVAVGQPLSKSWKN